MKSIAKYQVIEELGASPTGKTYRARDAFRNREFAVKILQTVPGLTAEARQQFCEQLGGCAELSHRHIAKIQDLGEIEEGIFIATEWHPGTDLRHFMAENRDLPLGQKLALIAQVAEGLGFAHSRGIAHGDLKPRNIFVDKSQDASILDFGIAKWLAALLAAGCRPEGLLVNYLAPEQVLGQPFGPRSDIFALGLMLYEFIAGKYPFSGDPGLIPREIVHTEAEPLAKLDPHVPPDLDQLVARALHKNPDQRLQTAEEFASGLYLAAQQLRRTAPSTSPGEQPAFAPPPNVEPPVVIPPSASAPGLEPPSRIREPQSSDAADLLPPAFAPQIAVAPPPAYSSAIPEAAPSSELNNAVGAPPARERPQDAATEPRPWTARSYAASTPLPPVTTELPPPPPSYEPPAPPAFEPPKSFLQPSEPLTSPAPAKRPGMSKRLVVLCVSLVLAAAIIGSLIARQNLKASQQRANRAIPAVTEPVAPVAKHATPQAAPVAQATPRSTRSPQSGENGPDDLGNPEFLAHQTLNGPVRSSWESGHYAQALALVNQVLANDPANSEARAWKKKIRDAQAAEAALK